MDIIQQIVSVPNIHAYLLLQSRGLSAARIKHALILASSSVIKAYAFSNQQHRLDGSSETEFDELLCTVDIRALSARLDLSHGLLSELVRLLVPDVLARMHRRLRGDSTLLDQLCNDIAA
jgi:hypothetical protein